MGIEGVGRKPASVGVVWIALLGLLFGVGACASSTVARTPEAVEPSPPPSGSVTEVESRIVAPAEHGTARELVLRGKVDFEKRQFAQALQRFERVLDAEPAAPEAPEAAYYAALTHEELGDHQRAAQLFSSVLARYRQAGYAAEAGVRAARLWVFLERYDAASDAAEVTEREFRKELSDLQLIALWSARALFELERGSTERAEYWLGKGRSLSDARRLDALGTIPRDLAQLYFVLGEVRRFKAESVRFDPLPTDFAGTFERRAQLVLDAQSAYLDVLRAEDAHWSAMAGTRIAELYERLHVDVMNTPRPAGAGAPRLKGLFEGAMRLRYLVLLEKGLAVLGRTLEMTARTGERSAWAERARSANERLSRLLAEENRTLDELPYSRDDLRRVLDELQRRRER